MILLITLFIRPYSIVLVSLFVLVSSTDSTRRNQVDSDPCSLEANCH